MNNKAFIGYFESSDPDTNNLLHEQVEAIKNVHVGKIVECSSDNQFNYDDIDEMLNKAIDTKCKEVVLLVNKDVNAKKLEEAIKEEYYKKFESVVVATEYFDRLDEAVPVQGQAVQQVPVQGQQQVQQSQQLRTNANSDISNKILLVCSCMIPDRAGEIDKYIASISNARQSLNAKFANKYKNIAAAQYDVRYIPAKSGKTPLVKYSKLVNSCGYNKSYNVAFAEQESCCINMENIADLPYLAYLLPPEYSSLEFNSKINGRAIIYNYDSSVTQARNKKMLEYLNDFNSKLKELSNQKNKDYSNRKDLENAVAIKFFIEVLGQYITQPDKSGANDTKLNQKSEEDLEQWFAQNYSNLGGDWENSKDLQSVVKFAKEIKDLGSWAKEKVTGDKNLERGLSSIQKAFLLWDKHNECLKFITDNYLK